MNIRYEDCEELLPLQKESLRQDKEHAELLKNLWSQASCLVEFKESVYGAATLCNSDIVAKFLLWEKDGDKEVYLRNWFSKNPYRFIVGKADPLIVGNESFSINLKGFFDGWEKDGVQIPDIKIVVLGMDDTDLNFNFFEFLMTVDSQDFKVAGHSLSGRYDVYYSHIRPGYIVFSKVYKL